MNFGNSCLLASAAPWIFIIPLAAEALGASAPCNPAEPGSNALGHEVHGLRGLQPGGQGLKQLQAPSREN